MCGRYANRIIDMGDWAELLGDWPDDIELGYNVAPTQTVPVFLNSPNEKSNRSIGKTIGMGMRWGLVPSWSKEINPKFSTFNARSETMAEKPAFRTPWKNSQTCLIPSLGYYEWKGQKGNKQPYFIRTQNGEPLIMAGLWDQRVDKDSELYSCTIITRPSEGGLGEIHSRMPLMLELNHAHSWLSDGTNRFNLISKQQHTSRFDFYPVDKAINGTKNQGEKLILKHTAL